MASFRYEDGKELVKEHTLRTIDGPTGWSTPRVAPGQEGRSAESLLMGAVTNAAPIASARFLRACSSWMRHHDPTQPPAAHRRRVGVSGASADPRAVLRRDGAATSPYARTFDGALLAIMATTSVNDTRRVVEPTSGCSACARPLGQVPSTTRPSSARARPLERPTS